MFKTVTKENLQVPAEINSLKRLRDFITRTGKKYRLTDKTINSFKLAIDEASTNIIRHAYRDKKGMITVRFIIRRSTVTVCIIDQGRFFDLKNVDAPDLKRYVAIGKKGGLGIFMIRKLVDEVDYRRTEEGNELRLTKKRDRRGFKFSWPSLAGSLRAKYYSVAAAIVSTIILINYIVDFVRVDDQILNATFSRMRSVSAPLPGNILDDFLGNRPDRLKITSKVAEYADQNKDFLAYIIVTDLANKIQGSSDVDYFLPGIGSFEVTDPVQTKTTDIQIIQVDLGKPGQPSDIQEHFVIHLPIIPRGSGDRTSIGNIYSLVSAQEIYSQLKTAKTQVIKDFLIVLLVANVGVGILILLVFIPLSKLSTWIKSIGEGDIKDHVEIDTSDEIGKIAHAFSEITDKFRESQKSLVDQEKIQQEMHLAKEIQQTLLPAEFPEMEGYEIASFYEAAKEVGGDYYDFVEIDRNRMGVVVADVSGKGVPGSLVMTMIRTAIRTEAKGRGSSADVLARVNDFILGDIRKGMFVTLFYIILDSRKRKITFASAGHNPMILHRGATKKTYYLNPKGFPVGISLDEMELFRKSIEDDTIQLSKDDIILCYTDGITEAMNSKRELFGEERLLAVMRDHGHLNAKQFVKKLREEILAFTEGQIQNDDISLVVIKENMNPEEAELEMAKQVYYNVLEGSSIKEACEEVGLPLTTFTHKYRKKFEEMGVDRFKQEFETTSVEAKHLSIEEQTKIYDIIRKNPSWGPKRISEQLETEDYGETKILPRRIYEELVRKRLNTKQLREAYVARGENKKRMKPPGTPMLTLDGQIIIEEVQAPKLTAPVEPVEPPPKVIEDQPVETKPIEKEKKPRKKTSLDDAEVSDIVLENIVDLLDKNKKTDNDQEEVEEVEEITTENEEDVMVDNSSELLDQNKTEVNAQELDDDVKALLGDLEETEEEHDEEIDFSDLSTEEYTKELFDDRSNGDEKDTKDQDAVLEDDHAETIEDTSMVSEIPDTDEASKLDNENDTEEMAKEVLEALSVKVEEEAGIEPDEQISTETEDDEFIGLISTESDIEYSEDIIEDSELVEDVEDSDNEKEVLKSKGDEETGPQVKPEEIFEELSVNIEDEENDLNEFLESDESNIDELVELVTEEEVESESSEPQEEKSIKKEEISVDEKKQKMMIVGGHYYMQKKYEKAISVFQRIIDKYPNTIEAYYNLGNSYFRLNKWLEAQNSYEQACDLDPTFLDAMENLGVIYANQKKFKKAIDIWSKILEHDSKRGDIKKNIEKAKKLKSKK